MQFVWAKFNRTERANFNMKIESHENSTLLHIKTITPFVSTLDFALCKFTTQMRTSGADKRAGRILFALLLFYLEIISLV